MLLDPSCCEPMVAGALTDTEAAAFTLTGPTISHHLRVLREAGLVDSERRGTWVYYRVVPAAQAALSRLLDTSAMTGTAGTGA